MIKQKRSTHFYTPLRKLFADSRTAGILLVIATIVSLLLANHNQVTVSYTQFWEHSIIPANIPFHFPHTVLEWINDGLMSFFFFIVSIEIRRELTSGELSSLRKSLLPVFAAVGGMVVPAIIFTVYNSGTAFSRGWGIPMATDIAFSLAVLSLAGKRVPVQLKIFLTALAIIDDLGAILAIAVFYTSSLHPVYLIVAAGIIAVVILLNKLKLKQSWVYLVPGIGLWYCLFNSGVHATIAGVLMAFAMPLRLSAKPERFLFYPVHFIILPVFALANTAIALPLKFTAIAGSPLTYGVIGGLVIGKPLGILLFVVIATKTNLALLPARVSYKQVLGAGMLGGIGFTMSIFITNLAFTEAGVLVISKLSVIIASVISALTGLLYFYCLPATTAQGKAPEGVGS